MTDPATRIGEESPVSRWVVSEFATVYWRANRIEITSATTGVTFATDNLDLVRLMHAFAEPTTIQEVVRRFGGYTPEQTSSCIRDFVEAGILVDASVAEPAKQNYWDWKALAFHKSTRQPGFHKSLERSMPGAREIALPDTILLTRGDSGNGRDLADVLEARRSRRAWTAGPVGLDRFSRLLWMSARNRPARHELEAGESVSRPYPSGGAAYSLELYAAIAAGAVKSIEAGLYQYLPEAHGIHAVSKKQEDYQPFLEAAGESAGAAPPPIVLIITSRFARQSETYGTLAYSLVLKEVGCLFQTLYLAAEYLGLGACALGGGAPAGLLARLCGTDELAEPVVGEFMIGPG